MLIGRTNCFGMFFFFCSVFGIIIIFYTRYISIFMVSDSQMVCLKIVVRVIFYLLFTMDE